MTLVRTLVSLTTEQHRRAKLRAADLGISLAEYIRGLVERDLEERPAVAHVSEIFGLGRSGRSDLSGRVDEEVGDAIWEEYLEETGRERRP